MLEEVARGIISRESPGVELKKVRPRKLELGR